MYAFRYAFLVILISCGILANAREKNCIYKTYAYLQERFAGTVMVDDGGNSLPLGVDTITYVYVETTGEAVTWLSARRNGQTYSVKPVLITENPFKPGMNTPKEETALIRRKAGNRLWQLELEPTALKEGKTAHYKNERHNDIILEGACNKQPVRLLITQFKMLDHLPSS